MLSDFGLISFILLTLLSITLVVKNFNHIILRFSLLVPPMLFVAIYSTLNEGLVSVKSGHIVFFVIGLIYWNSMKNIQTSQFKSIAPYVYR